jgi:hypothetical protein
MAIGLRGGHPRTCSCGINKHLLPKHGNPKLSVAKGRRPQESGELTSAASLAHCGGRPMATGFVDMARNRDAGVRRTTRMREYILNMSATHREN